MVRRGSRVQFPPSAPFTLNKAKNRLEKHPALSSSALEGVRGCFFVVGFRVRNRAFSIFSQTGYLRNVFSIFSCLANSFIGLFFVPCFETFPYLFPAKKARRWALKASRPYYRKGIRLPRHILHPWVRGYSWLAGLPNFPLPRVDHMRGPRKGYCLYIYIYILFLNVGNAFQCYFAYWSQWGGWQISKL